MSMAVRHEIVDMMPFVRAGVAKWAQDQMCIEGWWIGFFHGLFNDWTKQDYPAQRRNLLN